MIENKQIEFDNDEVKYIDENDSVFVEINARIKAIKNICYQNNIPMFFTCVKKDDGKETEYFSEMLSAKIAGKKLADDKIAKMSNVLNGFMTVPPHGMTEIEFETKDSGLETSDADFEYNSDIWGDDDDISEEEHADIVTAEEQKSATAVIPLF